MEVVYSSPDFYSPVRGRQETLSDGSILVTEFSAGRVFMVNPEGKIVYEYANPYGENEDGKMEYYEITNAQLIPKGFFTQSLECPDL